MAEIEEQVESLNGELVGVYWQSYTSSYTDQSLDAVSDKLDSYGWAGGWRIHDSGVIADTTESPPYLFIYLPFVFIIDTSTMAILAADGGDNINPEEVDVLHILEQIEGGK